MKILAINGSPNRDGSTSKLIDMVLEVCNERNAECEKLHLEDYIIGECGGCIKSLNECDKCQDDSDDFMQLKAKMLDADGIIIGSPYYSGKPTVQMKTFLNRLAYTSVNDRLFENKYIVGISTSAVNNSKKIAKFCASLGNISYMGDGIISGMFYESTVDKVVMGDLADNDELKEEAKLVGEKLIEDIDTKRKPSLLWLKKIIFIKLVKIICLKVIRSLEKIQSKIRRFAENHGWVKKINKIED